MQKYVYGCYSAGTRKDGRLDRHIELTTDMRFAVVNHNTSDDVLKEHDEIYGLWRIDEVRKDKKGKDFLICSLARALTVEEVDMLTKKWCDVISIMDALTKPIDEKDEDWKNKVAGYTMGDMTRTTLYRMLYGAGIEGDFETARDELFSRFVEGKVSLQTLMEYANTTIMSWPPAGERHLFCRRKQCRLRRQCGSHRQMESHVLEGLSSPGHPPEVGQHPALLEHGFGPVRFFAAQR